MMSIFYLFVLEIVEFFNFVAGDVTGDLVYVNYGRIEDMAELEQLGVSLTGTLSQNNPNLGTKNRSYSILVRADATVCVWVPGYTLYNIQYICVNTGRTYVLYTIASATAVTGSASKQIFDILYAVASTARILI